MSKPSLSPKHPSHWPTSAVRQSLAPVIPFKAFQADLVPAGAVPWAAAGLAGFRSEPTEQDRRWLDAVAVIALTVFAHVTIVDWYQHRPAPEPLPPKETQVEIQLVRPAPPPPPPPPPVVQPQPKPAPVKDAIPPKPKPKPKTPPPPPPPVVQQAPVQNAPIVSDAPPAPPAPPAPKPVEKVLNLSDVAYVNNPPPDYPDDALDRGWTGKVLLKVRILPSGKPDSVQVAKSSGHASLDAAAIKVVKGSWLFKPGLQGSEAVAAWVTIPIVFQL
jgi:protein TonB